MYEIRLNDEQVDLLGHVFSNYAMTMRELIAESSDPVFTEAFSEQKEAAQKLMDNIVNQIVQQEG